jgi:hypothetical protein
MNFRVAGEMIDDAICCEAGELTAVDAKHRAVAQPSQHGHAVAARDRGDLVARTMDDDSRPFGGPPALVKQQVGRQSRPMLRPDSWSGDERAGEYGEAKREAPERSNPATSSSNGHNGHHLRETKPIRFPKSNSAAI